LPLLKFQPSYIK